MAMPNRNIVGNNAAGLLQQAVEEVSPALVVVGFATSFMAVRAADSPPPPESWLTYPVRQGIIAGAFFCGVSTIWGAGWVAADPARRRATGRIILSASLVPMVIAVGLSNDYDAFFDILASSDSSILDLIERSGPDLGFDGSSEQNKDQRKARQCYCIACQLF